MPASNAGPASSHCPERTRDPNQFPSKVDATTPDRPTAVVRSDELETNQSRLRARADAGQLKRAWLARKEPGHRALSGAAVGSSGDDVLSSSD